MDSQLSIEDETDTKKLLEQLKNCLTTTVEMVIRMSAIVRRLEVLGVDVLGLSFPNIDYFRKIAFGQLDANLFVEFSALPSLLQKISRLPIPDQTKIAKGQHLKVMLDGGDHIMVAPNDMTRNQINQVFGKSGIRNDAQQAAWLAEFKIKQAYRSTPKPEIAIDRKRRGITVNSVFLSASDLAGYLSRLE